MKKLWSWKKIVCYGVDSEIWKGLDEIFKDILIVKKKLIKSSEKKYKVKNYWKTCTLIRTFKTDWMKYDYFVIFIIFDHNLGSTCWV